MEYRQRVAETILQIQQEICSATNQIEEVPFLQDKWQRKDGFGGGQSNIVNNGKVFEKAGCNVTKIEGMPLSQNLRQYMCERGKSIDAQDQSYKMFVTGVSLVFHPWNPQAPTVHHNYRYFEIYKEGSEALVQWFGGGADLTPNYLYEEDCVHFHQVYKDILDRYDTSLYPEFKKNCDEYFLIKHRGERRGIGGIFFDDFDRFDKEKTLQMIKELGVGFNAAYLPVLQKRKDITFTDQQKEWQQIRRGRYVEFNLVLDRGTKFGLVTPDANIEAILMSLPLTARWEYKYDKLGEEEKRLQEVLINPRDWI